MEEDKFAKRLLEDIDRLKYGLKYYTDRVHQLEQELDFYKNAYENRVLKYINLANKHNEEV